MAGKHLHPWFSSARVFALVPVLAVALLTACSGGASGGGPLPSSAGVQNHSVNSRASVMSASAFIPQQGVYNSCEIDTALSNCEAEDAAMASDGYKWEINYIGLDANKTGSNSLQAWFTYDASIGLGQAISIKAAINDPVNVLTGTALLSSPFTSSLAKSCGATNNQQVISCIYSVANSVPGFNWKWYIYDEPGCPNQSIGYCQGTLAGGNYNNVQTLASYLHTLDPKHQVMGTQVGDNGDQSVTNNLYSWLSSAKTSATAFDHYPIPEGSNFGSISDIGTIASQLASTIASTYPAENMFFVGQAFSWYQESGKGCTSVTVCPYPTTAQLQQMRDQALYYSNAAGKPITLLFWYYWPDITCLNNYPGCNAAANRASLKQAAFAAFPTAASMGLSGASPSPSPSASPTASAAPTASPTAKASSAPTATPAPTSSPSGGTGTVPPQGVYNSCEIDTALSSCEAEDAAMASDGFKWQINYIGSMMSTKSTLQQWFTYDAGIGMSQAIAIAKAINDPVDVLMGTSLVTFNGDNNLANSCGATNNEQVISCIVATAKTVPGFNYQWYIYDEPGCPNQSIGYCQGTLAGGNYNNVQTLANYIKSIDPTHTVMGTQVGDTGGQTVTNTQDSWVVTPSTNGIAYDHYPIPQGSQFGTIDDVGSVATALTNTIAANNPSEQLDYVGQAFSWYQEGGTGCTSITVCPYPTQAQMQDMRDQALYYANQAGHPISQIFWYYWPDITCNGSAPMNYSGCNATANRAALKAAAFAPFPTTAPQ